ncbi:MAG: DUF4214 domain-containing protein [Gammaproteobacteria bacterium SHHR-1]
MFALNYLAATPVFDAEAQTLSFSALGQQLVLGGDFSQAADRSYQGQVSSIGFFDGTGTPVYSLTEFQANLTDLLANYADPQAMQGLFSGNDTLYGSAENDWLYGYAGSDVLVGGAGSDFIDGGTGTDYVWLSGVSSDYNLLAFNGMLQASPVNSPDVDTLVNVERILFSNNAVLAMDTDANPGAVFGLYYTALGRTLTSLEELQALGASVLAADRGASLNQVAGDLLAGDLMTTTYGELSDSAYVDLLYQNVLGQPASTADNAYWVDQLEAGMVRGDLLLGAAQLDLVQAEVAELTGSGVWFFV